MCLENCIAGLNNLMNRISLQMKTDRFFMTVKAGKIYLHIKVDGVSWIVIENILTMKANGLSLTES